MKCWLLLLAVFVACAHADCTSSVVYVDDKYELQSALMEAVPGRTISLNPNVVFEGSFVMKVSGEEGCPITIKAKNILTRSTIKNDDLVGLKLDGVSWVKIQNIDFEKNNTKMGFYGLSLTNCSNVTVEKCHFDGFDVAGLYMMDSSSNTIASCGFDNTGDKYVGGNALWLGYGVSLCEDNLITQCVFGANLTGEAIQLGFSTTGTNISFCSFEGTDGSESAWIRILGYNNTVYSNTFVNPDNTKLETGIFAGGAGNYFEMNTFDLNNNRVYAILNQGSDQTVCASNKAVNAAGVFDGKIDPSC